MLEYILFSVYFDLLMLKWYHILSVCKVFGKRKYLADRFDLLDEPQAKKLRPQVLVVNRVLFPGNDDVFSSERDDEQDGAFFFDEDDDSIFDYMSDSTMDEVEYFSRDPRIYLNQRSSSDSDYSDILNGVNFASPAMFDHHSDAISISSESSLSIISVSSSSTVEFINRTIAQYVADVPVCGKYNNILCF